MPSVDVGVAIANIAKATNYAASYNPGRQTHYAVSSSKTMVSKFSLEKQGRLK